MEKIFEKTKAPSASIVVISSNDLVQAMETMYLSARRDAEQQMTDAANKAESDEMVTSKQARILLQKSQNTLWKWAKKGYLVPVRVGGTLMYRLSDVNKIMGGR